MRWISPGRAGPRSWSSSSNILLGLALRGLPVGTGYAVWAGTDAVGAAIAVMVWFNEAATLGRILPIALIVIGIV
ncbi:MAG: SMR family transporter [Solirubrobacterales bacterium]|nr:SMR family transporter [Solirubrobacterales bacterium]